MGKMKMVLGAGGRSEKGRGIVAMWQFGASNECKGGIGGEHQAHATGVNKWSRRAATWSTGAASGGAFFSFFPWSGAFLQDRTTQEVRRWQRE